MSTPPRRILDSFALLAHAQNEPGAPMVGALLQRCARSDVALAITTANLGEVFYRTQKQFNERQAWAIMAQTLQAGVEVTPIDLTLATVARSIKVRYRMGYLDSFVVALAQRYRAAIVTGDPDFQRVAALVPVEWLPQR